MVRPFDQATHCAVCGIPLVVQRWDAVQGTTDGGRLRFEHLSKKCGGLAKLSFLIIDEAFAGIMMRESS